MFRKTCFIYLAAVVLTAGIFILDLKTPLNTADWILYMIPLLLAASAPGRSAVLLQAGVGAVLIAAGLFHDPPKGSGLGMALLNRLMMVGVLGVTALALARRRQAEEALTRLRASLETEVRARTAELSATNERLRKVRSQQRALLDSIPDLAWLKDRESRYIGVNRPFGQACGLDPKALVGRTDLDAWPKELAEAYRADDRLVMESRRMKRVEEPLVDSHGIRTWIETIKVPILGEAGEIVGTAGIARDVTGRRQAEEALRASEERFRVLSDEFKALLDAIPDMVYFKDVQGRHRFVNRSFEDVFGLRRDEVAGKTAEDLLPSETAAACRASDQAVMEARSTTRCEEGEVRPDGTVRSFESTKAPIFGEGGEVVGLVGVTRDITRRKRAEEELAAYRERLEQMVAQRTAALREANERLQVEVADRQRAEEALKESEERLRLAVEHIPDTFVIYDADLRFRYVNAIGKKMMGFKKDEEYLGRTNEDVFPPELTRLYLPALKEVIATGRTRAVEVDFDLPALGMKGRSVSLIINYVPLLDDKGKVRQILGVTHDLTDRKRAEAAIKDSEERFRTLVEHSLVGFFIVQEGQIAFMNPEQERIFGACAGHRTIRDFACIHSEDKERFEALCREGRPEGSSTAETDLRFYAAGRIGDPDALRWAHGSAVPIRYRRKEAVLVTLMDITRAKEFERIALTQEKMATLGQVAAGIAHELRNPLSGLNIYLTAVERMLAEDQDIDPERRQEALVALEKTKSASGRIESVIRRVMDFAKPTPPRLSPVQVNETIREAVQLARVTLKRDGVAIETKLAEPLPSCYADPRLLEQVLLNLITNAAQALENSEGRKRIEVVSEKAREHVVIKVSDSGPGVPESLREKVFDPFFTTKGDGTGFGLSFSRKIIADHGGYIEAGAGPLGGAEFRIGLPAGERGRPPEKPRGGDAPSGRLN